MRIYSSPLRQEFEVFAVSISFDTCWPTEKRTVFYVKDAASRGLIAQDLSGSTIIDSTLSAAFKLHVFPDGQGLIFLSDYFENIDHLSLLIDFDPETVDAFEESIASGSYNSDYSIS